MSAFSESAETVDKVDTDPQTGFVPSSSVAHSGRGNAMDRSDALWSDAELNSVRQMARDYAERQLDTAPAAQGLRDHALRATRDWQGGLGAVEQLRAMAIGRDSLDAFSRPSLELREWTAGSVFANFEASWRESMDTLLRPFHDAQERLERSVFADCGASWRESMVTSAGTILNTRESIADSFGAAYGVRSLESWESIADSMLADRAARRQEMLDATKISLLDPLQDWNAPFRDPGPAYPQAPEVAVQTPAVDLQGPIGLPTRRTRQYEIVQVGVAVPDAAKHLAEDLIARHEVATDPFLYECISEVRHQLQVGRLSRGVDRPQAAVHRMLQILALEAGWEFDRRDGVLDLYRYVRKHHPVFAAAGGDGKALELFGSLAPILHKINEARNQHSLSHPSRGLLSESSARFFIHVTLAMFEFMADRGRATQDDA